MKLNLAWLGITTTTKKFNSISLLYYYQIIHHILAKRALLHKSEEEKKHKVALRSFRLLSKLTIFTTALACMAHISNFMKKVQINNSFADFHKDSNSKFVTT